MCTDCQNETTGGEVYINYAQEAYCEQCGTDNVCIDKLPAKCVIYNLDECDKPSGLVNMNIPSCTSLQTILEQIDHYLNSGNVELETTDSPSISFFTSGVAHHHLTASVNLSEDEGNTLFVRANGLYGVDSGKVKVNEQDELAYLIDQVEAGIDPLGIVSLDIQAVGGKVVITPTIDVAALCLALQSEGCLCQSPDNVTPTP